MRANYWFRGKANEGIDEGLDTGHGRGFGRNSGQSGRSAASSITAAEAGNPLLKWAPGSFLPICSDALKRKNSFLVKRSVLYYNEQRCFGIKTTPDANWPGIEGGAFT
jgi:hypothetical protein